MPYGSLDLFQVSSMGRDIPYYSVFLFPSWDLPLPTPIPKPPPSRTVGMVTPKPSQPHPGLLLKGGNIHTWLQYFTCQGSQTTSPFRVGPQLLLQGH